MPKAFFLLGFALLREEDCFLKFPLLIVIIENAEGIFPFGFALLREEG
jgi:hypothetical protein